MKENQHLKSIRSKLYDALDRGIMDQHTHDFIVSQARSMAEEIDKAYRERNRLVAALSRFTPLFGDNVHLAFDPEDPDWRILYIEGPTGQMSWHIHKDEARELFHGEEEVEGTYPWDGHTTEEKYDRLSRMGL